MWCFKVIVQAVEPVTCILKSYIHVTLPIGLHIKNSNSQFHWYITSNLSNTFNTNVTDGAVEGQVFTRATFCSPSLLGTVVAVDAKLWSRIENTTYISISLLSIITIIKCLLTLIKDGKHCKYIYICIMMTFIFLLQLTLIKVRKYLIYKNMTIFSFITIMKCLLTQIKDRKHCINSTTHIFSLLWSTVHRLWSEIWHSVSMIIIFPSLGSFKFEGANFRGLWFLLFICEDVISWIRQFSVSVKKN